MKRLIATFIMVIVIGLFTFSCAIKDPYLGRMVNLPQLSLSKVNDKIIMRGHSRDQWFVFNYKITSTNIPNTFVLEGRMDAAQGGAKSFSNIVIHKSKFNLLLSNHQYIIKSVSFIPKGTSLSRPLTYRKQFTCNEEEILKFYSKEQPFYGAIIYWKAYISG